MKKISKRLLSGLILIFALMILLSTIVHAKPFTDAFRGGLIEINNFFTGEQYKPYAKAIDFFFFSLLFVAIYLIGVRYAFREVGKSERVIAVLFGLISALLLVLKDYSIILLIPYIDWLLPILLFIIFWLILKGINSRFWRFVVALFLTLVIQADKNMINPIFRNSDG